MGTRNAAVVSLAGRRLYAASAAAAVPSLSERFGAAAVTRFVIGTVDTCSLGAGAVALIRLTDAARAENLRFGRAVVRQLA